MRAKQKVVYWDSQESPRRYVAVGEAHTLPAPAGPMTRVPNLLIVAVL